MTAATEDPAPVGLDAVFAPARVALVGASASSGTAGALLWDNLRTFPGDVVPVTRSGGAVHGVPAHASLRDVTDRVDLAVVAVPAEAVVDVVADAAAAGIPAVVVVSGGFAEVGPAGAELEHRLRTTARQAGIRLIGPNGLGVQNCVLPLNASLAPGLTSPTGGISLVTQSGAYGMAVHTLATDEQARFAKLCSVGNQVDVTNAELLSYLARDQDTAVACFFLESLPDGRAFAEEAARVTPSMPVVVARTGRSTAGARAARSHTAALAGHDAVTSAVLREAGVVEVRSGLEMMDVARALAEQPPPGGARVGIVTNSGGTGVELTDLLAAEGLEVPELSPGLRARLADVLPSLGSTANPVDVTPVWHQFAALYPAVVRALATSGEVDVVVPIVLQRAATDPAVARALRDEVGRLREEGCNTPVHVCWVAPRDAHDNAAVLQAAGIPCFPWPARTARAVGSARRSLAGPARRPGPTGGHVVPLGQHDGTRLLDDTTSRAMLAEYGIDVVETRVCHDAAEARAAAADLGGSVVVKVAHPDLVHRSDVGGVRTGLAGPDQVGAAAVDLLGLAPGAVVLLQPELDGVELVVGGTRDPQFGPVVMVGLGGILVELLDDVTFGLAPGDDDAAAAMWDRLRSSAVLHGVRGLPAVDLDALAAITRAVGDLLVSEPTLVEVDLNPVIATASSAVAVDWRLLVTEP